MKTNKNLSIVFLILFITLCSKDIIAQSCKQALYNAEVQYNNGQFERTQKLLDDCISEFKKNESHYKNNQKQVRKVYELYINACNKARNTECAKAKRKELNAFMND